MILRNKCLKDVFPSYSQHVRAIGTINNFHVIVPLKGGGCFLQHSNRVLNAQFLEVLFGFQKKIIHKMYIKWYFHLKFSSFCVSPLPKSSSFCVSPLPKSSSFCVSRFLNPALFGCPSFLALQRQDPGSGDTQKELDLGSGDTQKELDFKWKIACNFFSS